MKSQNLREMCTLRMHNIKGAYLVSKRIKKEHILPHIFIIAYNKYILVHMQTNG